MPMRLRSWSISIGLTVERSRPNSRTVPDVGASSPIISLSSTDLPEPLRPTMTVDSPAVQRKLRLRRTDFSPNESETLSSSMTGRAGSLGQRSVSTSRFLRSGVSKRHEYCVLAADLRIGRTSRHNIFVSNASYLRLTKSETRDLADREYRARMLKTADDWQMSNGTFFTAFVVVAAIVTLLALILR